MKDKLPFLDSCTTLNDDGSLDLSVYRKPTHTNQYLNFDSNHHLQHKRSVVRTLTNRVNCMVVKPEQKDAEIRHVKSVLKANGNNEWAFKIPPPKNKPDTSRDTTRDQARSSVDKPYIRGTSEKLARISKNHGVGAYHKPFVTANVMAVIVIGYFSLLIYCNGYVYDKPKFRLVARSSVTWWWDSSDLCGLYLRLESGLFCLVTLCDAGHELRKAGSDSVSFQCCPSMRYFGNILHINSM